MKINFKATGIYLSSFGLVDFEFVKSIHLLSENSQNILNNVILTFLTKKCQFKSDKIPNLLILRNVMATLFKQINKDQKLHSLIDAFFYHILVVDEEFSAPILFKFKNKLYFYNTIHNICPELLETIVQSDELTKNFFDFLTMKQSSVKLHCICSIKELLYINSNNQTCLSVTLFPISLINQIFNLYSALIDTFGTLTFSSHEEIDADEVYDYLTTMQAFFKIKNER
jgi:hypothetical protein